MERRLQQSAAADLLIIVFLAAGVAAAEDSVRDRLDKVAAATGELMKLAKESNHADYVQPLRLDDPQEPPARRFPTPDQVARYTQQRPWTRQYTARFAFNSVRRSATAELPAWPLPVDAPALRALLADKDPAIRCLAIEALATLHEPEDVKRIAQSLDDETAGLPALGWNHVVVAMGLPEPAGNDAVDLLRSWHQRKVKTYAKVALKLMTGGDFDPTSFASWWERRKAGKLCLWYWEERLHRELAEVAAKPFPAWERAGGTSHDDDWYRQYQADQSQRRAAVLQTVGEELSKLSPEIEAKVRLLAINHYTTALGADLDGPLMGPCHSLRLPPARLLELLDRKGLWEDVDWDAMHFNALATQLGGAAEKFFRPAHAPRLQAALDREGGNLWWNGQAALCIGISRLLPPANTTNLADVHTRDGYLRAAVRRPGDVFVKGAVARELVRVAVQQNWPFLEQQFFTEEKTSGIPDLRMAIVQELGAPPLTPPKRAALATLLLDQRYAPLWTRPLGRMGDDMYRQYAIWAVNAHAGKEVLTIYDNQNLREPATAQQTLTNVLKKVAEVLHDKADIRILPPQ